MTKIEIINISLVSLGIDPVDDLSTNAAARAAAAVWPQALGELLRAHPWNFAMKRVQLPAMIDAPDYDYRFRFTIPDDCRRIVEAVANIYQVEGRTILADTAPLQLRYVAEPTDPQCFDYSFTAALAALIASYLAYPLTQSTSQQAAQLDIYKVKLQQAKSIDAQEEPFPEFPESDFVTVRG